MINDFFITISEYGFVDARTEAHTKLPTFKFALFIMSQFQLNQEEVGVYNGASFYLFNIKIMFKEKLKVNQGFTRETRCCLDEIVH